MRKFYFFLVIVMLCASAKMGFAQVGQAFHNFETYVDVVVDSATLQTLSHDFSVDRVRRNADHTFDTRICLSFRNYDDFLAMGIPYSVVQPTRASVTMATNYAEMTNGWNRYPTYSTYLAMMDTFQTRYPNLCEIVTILDSTPGGRKVLCAHISNNLNDNQGKPSVFYTSTMHGDEVVGYYYMLRLIDMLLSNYNTDPQITNLVNNVDIWICPLHNPDGTYYTSDNQINTSTSKRNNGNGYDLNRNFPDLPTAPPGAGDPPQPEMSAMMAFLGAHNFTLAANFHGGAEVFNYPWDSWNTEQHDPHADTAWWRYIGLNYVATCRQVYSSYMTDTYANGITEGGDWYVITGSMQDYHNWFLGTRHVTIEVSTQKVLPSNSLPSYWNYSYRSLLNLMEEANYGLHGTVTDSITGEPLLATVYVNNHDVDHSYVETTLPYGTYHRPIKGGQYSVTYSAEGYHSKTITLNVMDGAKLTQNVQLVNTDTNSCKKPKYVTINYDGGTSAVVSWSSTAQSCNLKVNNTYISNVTSPYTLTNLASSTHYDVQVQADCGGGDLSDWTDAVGFTTECLAQDRCEITLELTDSYGDGWNGASIQVVDVESNEVLGTFSNTSAASANETQTYTISVCNGRTVKFVWVSGRYDSECSYSILDVFGDVIVSGSDAMATTNYTVDCGLSACPKPNNLVVTETTGTTATLSWTENGTANAWQICLNGDETNLIDVTANPCTLTGLTAETAYTAKVRANCGDEQSTWSNAVSFVPSDKVTIGSGTATSNFLPFNNYYNYSLTQQIYTTAELGAAGNILSIDFYKNSTVQCNRNLDIYMVSTTKSEFSSNTDWIPVTDANKVFSGTVNFANNDWTTITLTTSFAYNGTNNVAIVVDDNTGSYKSNTNFLVFPTGGTNQAIYYYNDNNNYDPTSSPSTASGRLTSKNQMRVHIDRPDPVVCLAPTDLAVVEFDHQSAMLSWGGEADSWSVAYRASNEEQFNEDNTSDTIYMLTDLSPLTEYTVKVAANCGEDTVWCEEIMFSTLPEPCPAPENVMVTNVNRNSAVVSWTEAGDATSWVVAYRNDIDELFTEVEVSEPTYTLSDLAEGTLYVVKVRPVCDGVTEWSNMVSFTTPDACQTPVIDSVSNIEATTATVYWTGIQESYNVRYGVFEQESFIDFDDEVIPGEWNNDETYAWELTDTLTDGGYCIKSTNEGQASTSSSISFTATYDVDGVISFDAMFMDEGTSYPYDSCIFSIDGIRYFAYGAIGQVWYNMAYAFTAGEHTFTWTYSKDSSEDSEGDFFAIDNIKVALHNDTWTTVEDVTGDSYDMTGLTPNSVVAIQVQGNNTECENGVTEWSSEYLFITGEQLNVTQTIQLISGTNWVSFYVETNLDDLQAALVAAAPAGSTIKIGGQSNTATYTRGRWSGNLTWDLSKMYKINVTDACEITLEGMPINPADHPVTLLNGNNYLGFPFNQEMTLLTAFAGFAVNSDKVSGHTVNATYTRGRWNGSFSALQPGKGYIYNSAESGSRTFVFPESSR